MLRGLGVAQEAFVVFAPFSQSDPTWLSQLWEQLSKGVPDVIQSVLYALNRGRLLGWGILAEAILLMAVGLLSGSWLASWWLHQRHSRREIES